MQRTFGLLTALLLVLTGCAQQPTGTGAGATQATKTMQQLADSTQEVYKLETPLDPELVSGRNRFVFGLFDSQNAFAANKELKLFYGEGPEETARGPVDVNFEEGVGDFPFYRAMIDFPASGTWLILVVESDGASPRGAGVQIEVKRATSVPKVGDKPPSVPSPTVHDHQGVEDICTRDPEDPMHQISLDEALENGKPTVVVFATPALCTSRICGPVVDQVLTVRDKFEEEADFIHVEVFADRGGKEFAPAFAAWTLKTEPWTFVIDERGTIQARFEGPVSPGEIEAVLEEVL
ncbi:MAG: thioredoxin family protein [Actinobacteria bacterium]|nr:thioredoxin family protein [Actinomycetota bacterium]